MKRASIRWQQWVMYASYRCPVVTIDGELGTITTFRRNSGTVKLKITGRRLNALHSDLAAVFYNGEWWYVDGVELPESRREIIEPKRNPNSWYVPVRDMARVVDTLNTPLVEDEEEEWVKPVPPAPPGVRLAPSETSV